MSKKEIISRLVNGKDVEIQGFLLQIHVLYLKLHVWAIIHTLLAIDRHAGMLALLDCIPLKNVQVWWTMAPM